MPELKQKIPNIKVLFAGKGLTYESNKKLAKQTGVYDYFHFLGFRSDVEALIAISDVGISLSKREGLPMNVLEEMYMFLPIVTTKIRGHKDILNNSNAGFLFENENCNEFIEYINELNKNSTLRIQMGKNAHNRSLEFTIDKSVMAMEKIINKS